MKIAISSIISKGFSVYNSNEFKTDISIIKNMKIKIGSTINIYLQQISNWERIEGLTIILTPILLLYGDWFIS